MVELRFRISEMARRFMVAQMRAVMRKDQAILVLYVSLM